jgi:YcxB-like protein
MVKITFTPAVEDYVYISRCINGAVAYSRAALYLYKLFLFLNVICFPAYLVFNGHAVIGFLVFAASASAFIFILPESEKREFRKFYDTLVPEMHERQCEVGLTENGIATRYNGNETLIGWNNVKSIQETREAIYFFSATTGIAVRKSAFEGDNNKNTFLDHARSFAKASKNSAAELPPVSAISS